MKKMAAETRERKRFWFYFDPADFKGVQDYLNEKAARGWELVSTCHLLTGEFVPTNRTELTYYVDLEPPREDEADRLAYLRLCEDAGWELVGTTNRMRIFKSLPCRHPVPVQTDGELEAGNFRRYTRRQLVESLLYLLLVLTLNLLPALATRGGDGMLRDLRDYVLHSWYTSWFLDACLIILPLLAAGLVLSGVNQIMTALWFRRSVRMRGMLPTPPWPLMLIHSGGSLLYLLFVLLIGASVAAEGLATGKMYAAYLWLAVWMGYLLLEAFVEVSGRSYSMDQKRAMLRCTAVLLVVLAGLVLLDWKGPWQDYSTAAWSSETDVVGAQWRREVSSQPVVQQEDFGWNRELFSADYQHGTSLFASWWIYSEDVIGGGPLESRCYRCYTEEIARRVAEDLAAQAAQGSRYHLRSTYQLAPVELEGFDGSWYSVCQAEDGEVSSMLVLRQGKQVAMVTAPAELIEGNRLEIVCRELGFRR